jgi:PrcB C-terminal
MTHFLRLLMLSWMAVVVTAQSGAGPRTIDKGDQSNIDDRREVVVRTAAEWEKLWHRHSPDRPMPSVDFSKEMVVGVFLGSRPTAGYGVAIVKTIDANGVLHVQYRENAPGRDAITAQLLTFPYHLVAISKSPSFDVKFEKIS